MFSQFALHERLLKAVAELKFVEPTPVQAAAIPLALQGRDLRVTAQTGSGKTAAFVLPVLNRLIGPAKVRVSIKTLILLPTRELAQQTLKEVERFSQFTFIKSGIITGGEDFKVQAAMLRKVPDILIGTPGRMIEQLNAGNLDLKEVEVLVLKPTACSTWALPTTYSAWSLNASTVSRPCCSPPPPAVRPCATWSPRS